MKKYTVEDIKKITGEDIILAGSPRGMSVEELKNITKQAVTYATERRKRALEAIEKNNLPLPISFKEWRITSKERVDKDIDMSKISKDYGVGFATVAFEPPKNATLNELKHALRLSRDFLKTKTSIIGGSTYIDPETGKKAVYVDEKGEVIYRRKKSGEIIYRLGKPQPVYKLTGWAGAIREVEMRLASKTGFHFTREEYNEFWRTYVSVKENKTVEAYTANQPYGTSEQMQELVYETMNKFSSKEAVLSYIIDTLKGKYNKAREEDIEDEEEFMEEFESGGTYFNGGSNR